MPSETLNSHQLHAMIVSGCLKLSLYKNLVNEINVFPVADGDTGDNLTATSQAIIHFSSAQPRLRDTLLSIANASIIGARGNSGIIFSHFFNLMAEHTPSVEALNFEIFSAVLTMISKNIDSILSNPVEGTILTLIHQFALHAANEKSRTNFAIALPNLLPLLLLDVEQTKNTLAILKKSNVVDAGAMGFYYFIEGMCDYLQDKQSIDPTKLQSIAPQSQVHTLIDNPPKFRYCTEAVLSGENLNKSQLLQFIKSEGDSASLTGNEKICRIHVHTNNPQNIFTTLYMNLLVQNPKVDDMQRQYEMHHNKKYRIALVTDSSADLPNSIIDEYQIHQICLNIQLDDHQLLDKYSFAPEYFYKHLNSFKNHPKSSCLNTNFIRDKLERIAKHYDQVLILSVSSKMSGMYDAFQKASNQMPNIFILDTKVNSGAHGLLLQYAGKLIASGMDINRIITLLKTAIKNTFIFVIVNDFKAMVRSGRINKISGTLANWINIKPIVSIDSEGRGIVVANCFSMTRARKKIIHLVKQKLRHGKYILEDYCIVHAGNDSEALNLSQQMQKSLEQSPLYIEPVSLSIGLHAGKGCVALAARIRDIDQKEAP